jgi:lipoate-protein ligase B
MGTKKVLIAVRIGDRDSSAMKVQQALTKHGCNINVRLGLHDSEDDNVCSPCGTMILQLSCSKEDAKILVEDLCEIDSVKAQFIDLD